MQRLALLAAAGLSLDLSVGLLVAPALAADLPSRYAPAPYYAPPPLFTYGGLYAGINGQLGIGSVSTSGGAAGFGRPFGGLGGATLGYNYQQGQLLVGLEADIGFGSISSPQSNGYALNSGAAIHGLGTGRARVGYVWDRLLIYATGGYAGAQMNGTVSDFATKPAYVLSESHYLNGFALGAGVEYALTTRISVKGEYLYTQFGKQGYFPGTRDSLQAGPNINLIRAGLNYHF